MKLVFREQLITLLVLFLPCRLLHCAHSSFMVQGLSTSMLQGIGGLQMLTTPFLQLLYIQLATAQALFVETDQNVIQNTN